MRRPAFYIAPTFDGPAGTFDVCQPGIPGEDDGPDEVVFNGTLADCRHEYPGARMDGNR